MTLELTLGDAITLFVLIVHAASIHWEVRHLRDVARDHEKRLRSIEKRPFTARKAPLSEDR